MRLIPLAALATLAALALAGCTVVVPPSPGTGPAPGTGVPPGAGTGVPPGPGAGTGTPGVVLPPSAGGGSGGSGGGIAPDTPAADRPGPGTPPAAGTDSCGASGLQHLVGRSVTAAGDLSARGPVRILRPGDAMTMDYAPRRINVLLDAQDRIREITCG